MATPASKLINHWRSHNLAIAAGNSEQNVRHFEFRNGVILPPDLREYFLSVDGMVQAGGQDCDPAGFSFWSLARVRNVVKECAEQSVDIPDVQDQDKYFVFADYLQWSWAYAIHLGDRLSVPNPIIHVGAPAMQVVAGSFAEFVELYLQDSEKLYVSGSYPA
jgi:hypothetical protein